jgi:hypothetical protein
VKGTMGLRSRSALTRASAMACAAVMRHLLR